MPKVDIWMPLYVRDYLADTLHLSAEQSGAYLFLIMHYWEKDGVVKNDIDQLSRIARVATSITQALLDEFFSNANGFIKHKRIDEELEKARKNREVFRERAEKAAQKRWENASSNSQGLHEQCPSPSPSPSYKDKEEEGGTATPVSTKPPAPISRMKEELADYWQSIITAVQPCSTWANFGRERKALNDIAARTRLLLADVHGYQSEQYLANDVLFEYCEMRDNSRDKLIRGAPVIPSKIIQFWPEITTSMAEKRRAESEAQMLSAMEVF